MDDAAPRVSALESQGELAARVKVEGDSPLAQLAHRLGCLLDQSLDGRGAAEAAPGGDRVGGVLGRRVAGSSAAASPPWAQKLALWESGVREITQTAAPCSAARSAVHNPAAPPPTTATSHSPCLRYRPAASRRSASI